MRAVFVFTTVFAILFTGSYDSSATTPVAPPVKANVIYGKDNRKNLYEVTDSFLVKLADATVALFRKESVITRASENDATLVTANYQFAYALCGSERFLSERIGAFCSGFLVAEDTVVTAGHCIEGPKDCENTKFVFGFNLPKTDSTTPKHVPKNEVYSCKSVVAKKYAWVGPDYAVLKLDRPVKNHSPLQVNRSGYLARNAELAVIGHPSGLPTKVSDEVSVRSLGSGSTFTIDADTYDGNSGSAVINSLTGEVEGILVQGETDFIFNGACYASKVCAQNECSGEKATKISYVLDYL